METDRPAVIALETLKFNSTDHRLIDYRYYNSYYNYYTCIHVHLHGICKVYVVSGVSSCFLLASIGSDSAHEYYP